MTGGFSFWDPEIWSFVVTLAVLFAVMLIANALKRKVKFIRRSLLPSAVIGGFIALIFNSVFRKLTGNPIFELSVLESITYHGLGLGFIALAWRHLDGVKGKEARRDVFNTATVTVGGYLLQGITGLIVTVVLSFIVGGFAAGGILLPMGYGQGPGQAFNWGSTYETQYGFVNGTSFGLTVAAMGFVSSSAGALIYLNKIRKKYKEGSGIVKDSLTIADYYGDNEIPVSESMDKLTVQFALVFMTYMVAYLSMWLLYRFVLKPAGGFILNTINPLLWGFNFLVGTAWAILFRTVGDKLRTKGIMHRKYTNDFMLNRISGLMFDLMVAASIASIDVSAFSHKEFWIPLLLLCIAGAAVTYIYTGTLCRHLFPGYSDEMFLAMYGMLTGTASTGIILLREIDPMFKTRASHNLIYQNMWAILLGAPMLLMMGFVARSMTYTMACLTLMVLLFTGILAIQYRVNLFRKKEK